MTTRSPEITVVAADQPFPPCLLEQRALLDEDGEVWLVVGRSEGGIVLSFPDVADFVVDLQARRVACHLTPDADPLAVRHALLDHVLPRILGAIGGTVLHASGIMVVGRAVLFAGQSGSGKSTLAARCAALGYDLLGDDAMVLEREEGFWRVHPSYAGLRLWQESIDLVGSSFDAGPLAADNPKRRVHIGADKPGPGPSCELSTIVMIERRPGRTSGRRLSGSESFARLWGTTFGWPATVVDPGLVDRVSALATEGVVLSLGFADDVGVGEVLTAIDELSVDR